MQYNPLTPDDPTRKRVLSHTYRAHGVRGLLTSSALLGSTSLVFAYGLDLFASRVAPFDTFDMLSESFSRPRGPRSRDIGDEADGGEKEAAGEVV